MRRSSKRRGAPLVLILGILCAAGADPRPVPAADFQLTPSLSVSEEFNDNVLQTATDEQSDFVTRVLPGAVLSYRTPSLVGDLRYAFDYINYARGSRGDEKKHDLAFHGGAAVIENFFHVELEDTLRRVSLDVARDVTAESAFLNQTDRNIARVSPYLLWRPGQKSELKTGYRFTDTRYWSVAGNSSGIDKQEQLAFANLSHDLLERLNISAGYAFSSVAAELVRYDQHDISVGTRYQYADSSFLFGGIGNSWQSFSDSRKASNLVWSAGVNNDFGFVVATVEARVQYVEDPSIISTKERSYSARLEKTWPDAAAGFSCKYSKYIDTQTGVLDRRKAAITGFGRYEFSPRLGASVAASGDRISRKTAEDYPYHFSGSAALSYRFNYDISASLTYNYMDYRRELDSASGARQTNRVIIEVRKVL